MNSTIYISKIMQGDSISAGTSLRKSPDVAPNSDIAPLADRRGKAAYAASRAATRAQVKRGRYDG